MASHQYPSLHHLHSYRSSSVRYLGPQVRGAVLAPRQGLLKGRDRLYAARAFFEALQLQKDKKVPLCAQASVPLAMRKVWLS